MGKSVAEHPDQVIFALLSQGFSTLCYDGQPLFDEEHPIKDHATGAITVASNSGGGSGTAWFLLDTSRAIKPLVWQERVPFTFQSLVQDNDEHVFTRDQYLYGIRGRANAGFALWQLAYGSQQTLDGAAYAAARVAMMSLRGDEGRPLGIVPNLLVVPPALEEAAREILVAERNASGATNVWKGSAGLIIVPWLEA
jgi:phage major head subunit gpT-like protein